MLGFFKRHWFILALTAAALAAAAVAVLFPPVWLAALTIGLASSSAFAALGAAAVPVAIATVAVASAAAVYVAGAILKGAASLFNWAFHKMFGPKNPAAETDTNPELTGDDAEDAHEDDVRIERSHTAMQSLRAMPDTHVEHAAEAEEEAHVDAQATAARRAAPANDARCCGMWGKKPAPAASRMTELDEQAENRTAARAG